MTRGPVDTDESAPSGGRWNLWLGGGTLTLVALCLLVWFPRDISSGLLIAGELRAKGLKVGEPVGRIGLDNLLFLARAGFVTAASLTLMTWGGPLVVWASNAAGLTDFSGYRAASGRFPYNVAGFFIGGTALSASYIYITRRALRTRDLVVAMLTTAFLILLFAGLLDNIQLPPNADL